MSYFSLVTLRQALATVQNQMLDIANNRMHGFGSAEYVRWENQANLIEASVRQAEANQDA